MKRYRTLSWAPATPAPGQGAVIVPSPIQRARLRSVMFTFTTSAAVANRLVWLRVLDPNNVPVFGNGSTTAIAAASSSDFVASPAYGLPTAIQGPVRAGVGLGIPDMWLPPGWKVQIGAVAIDAGDQFSAITFGAEFAEDVWDQEEDDAVKMAFLSSLMT